MEKFCLSCNSLLNPNGKNISYQKYCSLKCKDREHDKRRYAKRKDYLKIKSLQYYHKNSEKVLKKQIKHKQKRYLTDKDFHKKDNVRKLTAHNISLKNKQCEICKTTKDLQRHHQDYSKPLEIIILCRKCHNETHEKRT